MPKKKVRRRNRNWFYAKPSTVIQVDPDWKGMRDRGEKGWYKTYLQTKHWHDLRKRIFERDGYCCTRCYCAARLEAHHLTYERLGHELLSDLTTLCNRCHRQIHEMGATGY